VIAQVHAPDDEDGYTLTLDDEGLWLCPEFPEMAAMLNARHSGTFAEWNGPAGAWQANDAAEQLDGEITYLRS
jgi:hypothetical protein